MFSEELEELIDLVKIVYEPTASTGAVSYIRCFKLAENKWVYFRTFVISEFFANQGAVTLSYVISDEEPKDFLHWDIDKNKVKMKTSGRAETTNDTVILVSKMKKLPQFVEEIFKNL